MVCPEESNADVIRGSSWVKIFCPYLAVCPKFHTGGSITVATTSSPEQPKQLLVGVGLCCRPRLLLGRLRAGAGPQVDLPPPPGRAAVAVVVAVVAVDVVDDLLSDQQPAHARRGSQRHVVERVVAEEYLVVCLPCPPLAALPLAGPLPLAATLQPLVPEVELRRGGEEGQQARGEDQVRTAAPCLHLGLCGGAGEVCGVRGTGLVQGLVLTLYTRLGWAGLGWTGYPQRSRDVLSRKYRVWWKTCAGQKLQENLLLVI